MTPPVVLIHGLGQTRLSMVRMARGLRSAGRQVCNLGYPSRAGDVDALADLVWRRLAEQFPEPGRRFDFVAHSLGGILVRRMAVDHAQAIRRVVMLAPPNQGSEWVGVAARSRLARRLVGPAGLQVGCELDSLPNRLGPASFECGVIAGSRPDNPFSRRLIAGPEDGRVSVAHTALPGMACQIVVPHGHLTLMLHRDVIEQAEHFLHWGEFKPTGA